MKTISLLVAAAALAGCAALVERTAEKTAEAVNTYCDTFGAAERQAFGDRVRQLAAPDSIDVTCG
jgi:uncharacterized protein YceK